MIFESDNFFNKYEVGDKLGHGHFAEVKYCLNKIEKSEYAAKFIRRRQLLDPKHIGMNMDEIEREANILKRLNHQNIIKLFFCYDLGKNIVLILELVSGGELFDHISDSEKLSEEEASEFVEQIVLGLNHMHERNIVHLDLKPENVMIEDLVERKIKLIDFGLAREIKNKNTIIEMQGTAEFLAPEVIEYNPISYATDMWAIGVITYIMLTGVSPFSGDDQVSTFQNIVNCRLDFDEDICSDMTEMAKSFINSLLVLDAKKRAKASDCLVHPWIKPMEPSIVFRRKSSIISRDKLQSLKHFVVCPSPPSSVETTPCNTRKFSSNEDFLEDVEESPNDCDSDKDSICLNTNINKGNNDVKSLNLHNIESSVTVSNDVNIQDKEYPKNLLDNHDSKLITQRPHENSDKPSESESKHSCTSDYSTNDQELSLNEVSHESSQNGDFNNIPKTVPLHNEKANKLKFNTAFSNSVKKLNSKIDSIASLFDTKVKSNTPSKTNGRGSLKNLFTINTDSFFSNVPRSTPLTPATFSSQISANNVKERSFNSKPISASVATSPTISKKSIFFNRYVAALETKKKSPP